MKHLVLALSLAVLLLTACCPPQQEQTTPASFWSEDGAYFHQGLVVTPPAGVDSVQALVNGQWQYYELQTFPEGFMRWNIGRRLETIDGFRSQPPRPPVWSGPHNGIVATYGYQREDTQLSLNNAVKGMGFLPRQETIAGLTDKLRQTNDAPFMEKLETLQWMYDNADSLFHLDRQVSLELYSTPEFETQTFLNQMTCPVSTIVFLDRISYKLKTVCQLLHPADPELSEYEKQVVEYVNLVHSYFHGQFSQEFAAAVYYVVEVFDNSPGNPDAIGHRVMPPLP